MGYSAQAGAQGEIPPPGVPGAGYREWYPYHGTCDPCPPIGVKKYVIPPNQYIMYQPTGLPQYPLEEALRLGTLWPALYSPYEPGCGRS
nr:spore coat associated protein CotJA [Paenibacillus pasadenensis]